MESEYTPGTAYQRIFLPIASSARFQTAVDAVARTQSFVALRLLLAKLEDLFQSIEPAEKNKHVYGHKVRELLLLAAMETEASWAAVLKANGYARTDRLNTKDYVKLYQPMLLGGYSLSLTSYPEFPVFAPLKDWDTKCPTKSLVWYDAYNATKHNREEYLDAATLQMAVHAVGAVVVMFYAQFGRDSSPYNPEPWNNENHSSIRRVFMEKFDPTIHPYRCYVPDETIFHSSVTNPWAWKVDTYPF